jgi:hypothetical protein
MRRVMGDSYICDFEGGYLRAFWRNYRGCKFVEPVVGKGERSGLEDNEGQGDGEVFFFNGSGSIAGKALRLEGTKGMVNCEGGLGKGQE